MHTTGLRLSLIGPKKYNKPDLPETFRERFTILFWYRLLCFHLDPIQTSSTFIRLVICHKISIYIHKCIIKPEINIKCSCFSGGCVCLHGHCFVCSESYQFQQKSEVLRAKCGHGVHETRISFHTDQMSYMTTRVCDSSNEENLCSRSNNTTQIWQTNKILLEGSLICKNVVF